MNVQCKPLNSRCSGLALATRGTMRASRASVSLQPYSSYLIYYLTITCLTYVVPVIQERSYLEFFSGIDNTREMKYGRDGENRDYNVINCKESIKEQ